jgi:hypothetical protein
MMGKYSGLLLAIVESQIGFSPSQLTKFVLHNIFILCIAMQEAILQRLRTPCSIQQLEKFDRTNLNLPLPWQTLLPSLKCVRYLH